MAITIRNLTPHDLELISAERFNSEKKSVAGAFKTLGGTITNFLNATTTTFHEVHPKGAAHTSHALGEALAVPAFATVEADIPPPASAAAAAGSASAGAGAASAAAARDEILRLAFRVGGGAGAGAGGDIDATGTASGSAASGSGSSTQQQQIYETDVPSPSRRFAPMRKIGANAAMTAAAAAAASNPAGGSGNGTGNDGAQEDPRAGGDGDVDLGLTALYVPSQSLIAVFPPANLSAWMAALPDPWPLSLLSIPGTHNSPTCHTALPSVRCQSAPVAAQLAHGVRFLDVRVSVSPDSSRLALVHSAFPIALTGARYFSDMLADVYAFLDAHPSETVLMSIKREGTGKGTDGQLGRYLKHDYIEADHCRRRDRWWTEPVMPVLGRARGRIVLIRRFGIDRDMHDACWGGRGWGIDASQWPDNCEDGSVGASHLLRVQDFYEITETQNIEKKILLSRKQLERAAGQVFQIEGGHGGDSEDAPVETDTQAKTAAIPPFFVNFLSASNFFNAACWPERIAAKVNPAIVEYLCANHGRPGKGPADLAVGLAGTGVVVTDWVGANSDWDLIRCIVGMNARLHCPKQAVALET